MSVLIFILAIVALILVHEFGHFIAAKLSGMRVDEFGLGYPPRALTIAKKGETSYTLNWLPFGGFVKIHGEDGLSDEVRDPRAFSSKSRLAQAVVLVAGVAMNLLFAYVLITAALALGTPRALDEGEIASAKNVELAVADVLPGSPAAKAGVLPGDSILSAEDGHYSFSGTDPASFTKFVAEGGANKTVTLSVKHGDGKTESLSMRPEAGLVPSDPARPVLGVEVATIGVVPLSFGAALTEGARLTWETTKLTAQGLWHFFYGVFTFSANLSQVSGPIGIAGAVGSASAQGFGDLLSIIAVISINLALINLLPVPALDGGRLLFVIIESIIRRPIKPRVAQVVNSVGFALLILLMVVVTAHDIFKLAS
jgi:regulator of sigma E protease